MAATAAAAISMNAQLATAAISMNADLLQLFFFGQKESAPNNMNTFAKQIPGRGAGSACGHLLALVPRFARVGAARGVYFDHQNHLARLASWVLRNRPDREDRLRDAAQFDSRLHMAA